MGELPHKSERKDDTAGLNETDDEGDAADEE